MLKAGRIVALDTTASLLQRFSTHALRLKLDPGAELPATLAHRAEIKEGVCSISFDHFTEIETMLAELRTCGCSLIDLEIGKPDLEDVFVRVMHGQQGSELP